ncbi:MAG TPA: peptidylprolyl isomerase [Bacteroidia bacterium]|nr:peptidylprolyl isomerase [Bacteroidota bacterium]MBK7431004.1 peptidylprolyl isomerase [Bacteroidota bacterium]MBP9924114.1 peptidylprolyl isomerase [Bacteroidia bacterium]HQV99048.1 peptidylprolyl isomerase [Bacteroidia bacterium]HQW22364.1 peptidylprolyl isomerase [Bacteroidia bacterium]
MKKLSILFSILCLTYACKAPQTASKTDNSKKTNENIEHEVLISTSMGDMVVKLYNGTPQHRDNFLKLVNEKFYDSLLFHRVISGFMIQGGDPQSKNAAAGVMLGMGDVGYTIPAEFVDTLFHKKGALCAARTPNPQKASSGCQFYIVQGRVMTNDQVQMLESQRGIVLSAKQKEAYTTIGGTPQLDRDYTVYGEVIKGLDVLDKIASVKTAPGDRPVEDVRMKMKLIK